MTTQRGRKPRVAGVAVHGWTTQAEAASWFDLTTRQIQNLEKKGMPSKGTGKTKRYPVPHVVVWYSEYQAELALRRAGRDHDAGVDGLTVETAFAEHRLFVARLEASGNGSRP